MSTSRFPSKASFRRTLKRRSALIMALSLLAILCFSCSSSSKEKEITKAIEHQMQSYPKSRLKDLYKSFFQDAFGPGHLMSDDSQARSQARAYLMEEVRQAKDDPSLLPLYEQTGYKGQFLRVSLQVINDGLVPFDEYFEAFWLSAQEFILPSLESWKEEWAVIERQIRLKEEALPHMEEDAEAIQELFQRGEYASHHSREYEDAYHPHYRLIKKDIFQDRLLPLIRKASR